MRFDERLPAEAERRPPARGHETPTEREDRALHDGLLRLQGLVGNAAVTAMVSRAELLRDTAPAKEPPAKGKDEPVGDGYTMTVAEIGTFELDSFSWSVGSGGSEGGRGGGKNEQPKDMHVTKKTDGHSPKLMQRAADGRRIAKVEIAVRKGGKTYYTITLKDVMVTSYQTGGSSGGDEPTEQFSLNAGSMEVEYAKDGEESGAGGSAGGSTSDYPG